MYNTIVSYILYTARDNLHIMLEATTVVQGFGNRGMRVCIPAIVKSDSQNPLRVGDRVKVVICEGKIIVEPVPAAKARTDSAIDKPPRVIRG